jgi:hypothetical protein
MVYHCPGEDISAGEADDDADDAGDAEDDDDDDDDVEEFDTVRAGCALLVSPLETRLTLRNARVTVRALIITNEFNTIDHSPSCSGLRKSSKKYLRYRSKSKHTHTLYVSLCFISVRLTQYIILTVHEKAVNAARSRKLQILINTCNGKDDSTSDDASDSAVMLLLELVNCDMNTDASTLLSLVLNALVFPPSNSSGAGINPMVPDARRVLSDVRSSLPVPLRFSALLINDAVEGGGKVTGIDGCTVNDGDTVKPT